MRRGFLAVEPPPEVLDSIVGCVAHLRDEGRATHQGLRWTTRDQWHVTLQFLGRVGEVDALVDVVGDAVRRQTPFGARLGGGGAFPRPARASLLWAGLVDGTPELTALATAVGGATAELGYEAERSFRPHLTLARTRQRRDLRPAVDALGDEPIGQAWTVREVVLYESDTRPTGAVYRAVSRMPLGE